MKIIATGVLVSALAVLSGCQNMHGMGMKHHPMMDRKHQLNDAQIMGVVSTANMGEVSQGQLALQKSQMPQVREFAQKMVNDHGMNEQQAQALASRLGVAPQPSPVSMKLKKQGDDTLMMLNQAETKDFDKKYIESQVKIHREVLKTIDKELLPNAQNPELRSMLTQTRAAVATHLQTADQLWKMMK